MLRLLLISFLLCFASITSAQEEEYALSELLIDRINSFRGEKNLNELEYHETLEAAAFDQAKYIFEVKKVVHDQDNSKRNTVAKRVLTYEGLFGDLGENAAQIARGGKEALTVDGPKIKLTSDEQLTQAILVSWLKDEKGSKLNLLDPNYYSIGISVLSDDVNYTVVAVFGSKEYEKVEGIKYSLDSYGIEPYDEKACKNFNQLFPTLPQLISDVVKVEENLIKLKYHNLPFFKELLSGSKDALYVDVIQKQQFNCNGGNRTYPGKIAQGFLMKPFKKGRLLAQNLLDSLNEVEVIYDEAPSFYNASNELNLIVVKDGFHCATVPHNNVKITNKRFFSIPLFLSGASENTSFTWSDTIQFVYTDFNQWKLKWKADSSALVSSNFSVNLLSINKLISPIQKPIDGDEKINWDSLDFKLKGTVFQLDVQGMTKPEKLEYLKSESKKDQELAELLNGLNEVTIKVIGKGNLTLEMSQAELLSAYKLYLKSNNIEPALFIQAELLAQVEKQKLDPKKIPLADPSQKQNTLKVINNQIVLETILGSDRYGGNPIYLAFFELYLINKAEVEVAFNYYVTKLENWSENPIEINDFESWGKGFSKISSANIPEKKYARAKLNYNLVAIDYYYETKQFDDRKKSFTELIKWVAKADLNEKEILELAQTLCFHDQYANAIEVLKNSKHFNDNKELLLYFLQIAPYEKELISEKLWIEKLKSANEKFPKEFCRLFRKNKMGFQQLNHPEVKKMYCNSCN